MSANFFICHTESDAEFVDLLVEYLEASSSNPASITCSHLPGYALSNEESDSGDLRDALMRSDTVIAVATPKALVDSQFMVEVGAAWAFDRWIIPLLDPQLTGNDLPKPIRDLPCLTLDGPRAVTELGKHVCVGYVESQQSQTVLRRMFGEYQPENAPAESDRKTAAQGEKAAADNQPAQPQLSSETTARAVSTPDTAREETPHDRAEPEQETAETKKFPTALESLNAGIAFSDCMFNRNGSSSFAKELDLPLGTFIDALGGNWQNLRDLDDLDLFHGVTENLITSLPPARSEISYWYDIGSRISTLLNIAGRGLPDDPQQRELTEQKWKSGLTSIGFLGSQVNIRAEEISQLQTMLENLIGPENERDYTNIAKCLDLLRQRAVEPERA
ncbi:MAG: toll/interleukin-1 receptor domain-containing protein [Deltaproteobacteria bacterium]|nr:toll/interleukin-1 receptor domain-containing protein [Deltaproteobacteria bacterium]